MSFLSKLFGTKRENEPARPPAEAPRPEPPPARMSPPASGSFYPSGTRIAGRYEVAGRPLVGGMGIVYLCFDHQKQRPVALKTFKPEFLPDRAARERFLEEGNTWVRLGKHPHIVRCHNVFQDSPRPEVYLVLELVAKEEGRRDASLRSWLTLDKPLPVDQSLLIALQIVRGMRHAADTIPGFVHRDLKPENVLVGADRLSNASINRVRVTDFGLVHGLRAEQAPAASAADLAQGLTRLTRIGSIVGTPYYMAPEQWEDANVDVRADIYALGCILGEMLTGHLLVQGVTLDELRRIHQNGQAMRALRSVPDAVQELLAGCLLVETGQRYRDWATLEAALAVAYGQIAGRPAPEAEAAGALSRAERVAAGWSLSAMGASYHYIGKADAALGYFERARQAGQGEGERRLESAGLGNLGLAYLQLGDVQRAIGYQEKALDIDREIGDRRGEAAGLGNLGNAYADLGDARRAIGYYEQALAISREIGDRMGESLNLANLGSAYLQLNDAPRAIGYLEQALAVHRAIGDHRNEASALSDLGSAYGQLGDERRAIGYFEQALGIHREIGDRRGEGGALGNLGAAYRQLGDAQRAIECVEQALTIDREIGDVKGLATDCYNMALLYAQQGDQSQALPLAREATRLFGQIGHAARAQHTQELVAMLERQGR